MEYRILGKTGLKVSVVGFGGIPIQRVSAGEALAIVNRALDLGINFFDTARGYTDSEEKLGGALKEKPGNDWPGLYRSLPDAQREKPKGAGPDFKSGRRFNRFIGGKKSGLNQTHRHHRAY
jgi:predicted aldo/keto reductase-like oxidoreductase